MRIIEQKMIDWLDKRLALNGAAQKAIKDKDARNVFIYAVEACVDFIQEQGGNNRGPMVRLLQDTIGGPDPLAWCMSFQQTCLAYAEVKTGKKSPIFASETCTEVWNRTPKSQRVKSRPLSGAMIIWKKGNTVYGHTGTMIEWHGDTMETVEGNTGSGNMRDGDGVFKKVRSTKATGSLHVLGYLKPF